MATSAGGTGGTDLDARFRRFLSAREASGGVGAQGADVATVWVGADPPPRGVYRAWVRPAANPAAAAGEFLASGVEAMCVVGVPIAGGRHTQAVVHLARARRAVMDEREAWMHMLDELEAVPDAR